jgi:hypothetical protein
VFWIVMVIFVAALLFAPVLAIAATTLRKPT